MIKHFHHALLLFFSLTAQAQRSLPHRLSELDNASAIHYEVVNPLFSDYATKNRTIKIPAEARGLYDPIETFDLPIGTILTKTFSYSRRIETRVLINTQEQGWIGASYLWNDDQRDATLKLTGAKIPLIIHTPDSQAREFIYSVPNANQCKSCHLRLEGFEKKVLPIGIKARYLNAEFQGRNQLVTWVESGILDGLPSIAEVARDPRIDDQTVNVAERARAYLDVNCAHCHNPKGAANTSGLFLQRSNTNLHTVGVCKSPVAAGGGGGEEGYDIVPQDPDHSLMLKRVASIDPGVMMPELGRSLVHSEGLALIRAWILNMPEKVCH